MRRASGWKPWGFDAETVKSLDPIEDNSWYNFVTYLAKQTKEYTGPILAIQRPPLTWSDTFGLTAHPALCFEEAISINAYFQTVELYTQSWEVYKHYCIVTTQQWAQVTLRHGEYDDVRHACRIDYCSKMYPPHWREGNKQIVYTVEPMRTPQYDYDGKGKCVCNNGTGQYVGHLNCAAYLIGFPDGSTAIPTNKMVRILVTKDTYIEANNSLRANLSKGIGSIPDCYWICGKDAFLYLPPNWSGCCQLVNLTINNLIFLSGTPENFTLESHRGRRSLAEFTNIESYHWRISLGEKWGIGLFPWYGVPFLADHLDNITYTMAAFANETIRGFKYLSENDKSHRLTLLKHEMALDYVLARTGGLCVTLNLTGEACMTLIPDNSDNVTNVITALSKIRDAFGASDSAGFSFQKWMHDKYGPVGAMIIQMLIPVLLVLWVMICFCTCLLTFVRAMILRWVGGVMGQYVQIPQQEAVLGEVEYFNLLPVPGWIPPFIDGN